MAATGRTGVQAKAVRAIPDRDPGDYLSEPRLSSAERSPDCYLDETLLATGEDICDSEPEEGLDDVTSTPDAAALEQLAADIVAVANTMRRNPGLSFPQLVESYLQDILSHDMKAKVRATAAVNAFLGRFGLNLTSDGIPCELVVRADDVSGTWVLKSISDSSTLAEVVEAAALPTFGVSSNKSDAGWQARVGSRRMAPALDAHPSLESDTSLQNQANAADPPPDVLRSDLPTAGSIDRDTVSGAGLRRRGRPVAERPLIDLQLIAFADAELADQQRPMVERFQALLDKLAGGKGKTAQECKFVSRAVNSLANRYGIDIIRDGRTVSLSWSGGVFEAQPTTGVKGKVASSAGFLKLAARQPLPSPSLQEDPIGADDLVCRGRGR